MEFSANAEAQKFLSKSGKTLAAAIGAFTADMDTLINKTMEDTLVNARQYQAARLGAPPPPPFGPSGPHRRLLRTEYDAFRVDLEELNMRPRDASTLARLERAQSDFQEQRRRYQKVRQDLSVKVRLLEHNKVRAPPARAEPGRARLTPPVCR